MTKSKMDDIPYDVPGLWEGYAKDFKKRGIVRPRVVVHGGYGKKNMGDDAILDVLISRIRAHLPNAVITVVCHGPENIAFRHPGIVFRGFKSFGAFMAVLRSDVYIIGGGGIINKINAYSGFKRFKIFDMKGKYLFFAAFFAKLFGAKTHFYAIGATSFPDPVVKLLAKIVLSTADVVSVRDPLSIRNFRRLGITRDIVSVLDPALCLDPAPPNEARAVLRNMGLLPKPARKRPLVGINLRYVDDPDVDNKRSVDETAKLAKHLVRDKACDVLFIPVSRHPSKQMENDGDFGLRVMERFSDPHFSILDGDFHPRLMMAILGETDFMVLSRLHSVILGTKMRVPIFTVAYDDKVTQFARMAGLDNDLLSLSEYRMEKLVGFVDRQIRLFNENRGR